MIDEEATHKEFNYYSYDLKPQSDKHILAACDNCGKIRDIRKSAYRSLCGSCAHKGEKGSNWQGGLVECICQECGKTIHDKQSKVRNGNRKYCSLLCAHKGKNNPNWQGGISFEPYCIKFNDEYKQYIRTLFGNECFLCGKGTDENGQALDAHHVNYNKQCGCDESKCICIPLCVSCHTKTNFDRDYWQALIMEMLKPLEAWE